MIATMKDAMPLDRTDDEPAGLAVVWWLAALAGAVDASGVSMLKDLYVSFMSGNTTSFGIAIAQADWSRVGLIAGILAAFVGGAATGTMAAIAVGRYHLPIIVVIVAAMLAVAAAVTEVAVLTMTFAMGVLNAAMQHAGQVNVSITYITGALVKLGQGMGLILCRRAKDWAWLKQAVPWSGLLTGAVIATFSLIHHRDLTFDALPVAAVSVALIAMSKMHRFSIR
jgi:uncharacterized membrane protein YoaK (UPF0700 family)